MTSEEFTFWIGQFFLQMAIIWIGAAVTGLSISIPSLFILVCGMVAPYLVLDQPWAIVISSAIYLMLLPKLTNADSYIDVIFMVLVIQTLGALTLSRQARLMLLGA